MNENFTINEVLPAPRREWVEAFLCVPTAHISDNLQRIEGILGLRRFHRSRKLIGTAVTVKVRAGDNLLTYKALSMMSPGHVLVVDAGGRGWTRCLRCTAWRKGTSNDSTIQFSRGQDHHVA